MEGKRIILTQDELSQFISVAIDQGVSRVLQKYSMISPWITRQEIIGIIGRSKYEDAVKNGQLIPQKNKGKNSKAYVLRREFDEFILRNIT